MKVKNELMVYGIDGKETCTIGQPIITVESHFCRPCLVVLIAGDRKYTVAADDLIRAVKNARND